MTKQLCDASQYNLLDIFTWPEAKHRSCPNISNNKAYSSEIKASFQVGISSFDLSKEIFDLEETESIVLRPGIECLTAEHIYYISLVSTVATDRDSSEQRVKTLKSVLKVQTQWLNEGSWAVWWLEEQVLMIEYLPTAVKSLVLRNASLDRVDPPFIRHSVQYSVYAEKPKSGHQMKAFCH